MQHCLCKQGDGHASVEYEQMTYRVKTASNVGGVPVRSNGHRRPSACSLQCIIMRSCFATSSRYTAHLFMGCKEVSVYDSGQRAVSWLMQLRNDADASKLGAPVPWLHMIRPMMTQVIVTASRWLEVVAEMLNNQC